MKTSPLREKRMKFAVEIVAIAREIRDNRKEFVLANQLLRSGTSIGANLAEAAFALSAKDFLNKCKIALKECAETGSWLELLVRTRVFPASRPAPLRTACEELRKMLSATCKTTEEKLASP